MTEMTRMSHFDWQTDDPDIHLGSDGDIVRAWRAPKTIVGVGKVEVDHPISDRWD